MAYGGKETGVKSVRSRGGNEARRRLIQWDKGQAESERFAGQILELAGFTSIDPSHPLGGKDGVKDVVCEYKRKKWIGASYFPREPQTFAQIKKKFRDDAKGIKINDVDGIAFVTDQKISVSERAELKRNLAEIAPKAGLEIFHLERITQLLNSPRAYGIRLEFLDIEMTGAEQVAFIAERDKSLRDLNESMQLFFGIVNDLLSKFDDTELPGLASAYVPVEKLKEFKNELNSIVGEFPTMLGNEPINRLNVPLDKLKEFKSELDAIVGNSYFSSGVEPINRLNVPLDKLKEFKSELISIVGELPAIYIVSTSPILRPEPIYRLKVPLEELKEFKRELNEIVGGPFASFGVEPINKLKIPIEELKEYESILERVLEKLDKVKNKQNILKS